MSAPQVGDRVTLTAPPDDPWTQLKAGTKGTITHIDSMGTFHVRWDDGSTLGLIPELDHFTVDGRTPEDDVEEVIPEGATDGA